MKKLYPLLSVLFLIYWGCEEEQPEEVDTTPPTVTVTFPQNGSTVYEIVTITCMSSDNEGVEKVELWVNGVTTGLTDNSEPYSFDWNTTTLEDGNYTIIIRSYDTNENTTDSEPVVLTIDNSLSVPQLVNITSVTYTFTEMTIEWEQSSDGDFNNYKVLYSESESGNKDTIQTYTDISTTSYTITEFDPLIENWFWVQVTDTLGFSSIGTGMTNEIESTPPTPSVLYPITFNDGFQISWSQNYDDDFQSYKLYESLSEDMSNQTLVYETSEREDTNYVVTGISEGRYYQITTEDVWGLQSISDIEVVDYEVELWGELYSIENTTELVLVNSGLTGSIPSGIGNLTNLTVLILGGNQLSGSIPPEIGNLTNLTYLNLQSNQLTGSIPSEIGNLTNLENLILLGNQLTGTIPPEIGNLTNLTSLSLSNNQLTGIIPDEICNQGDSSPSLSNNQLCPPYPSCIEDDVGGQDLINCEGVVELWGEYYSIEYTTELDLSNRGLTGEIPPEIENLTNLESLNLYNNQLTGSIPSEIGNLTNLTSLVLWINQLTGEIPPEIGNLTNLIRLDLDENQLTGSIPSELGNFSNLTLLSLGSNQLTGEIPPEIWNLTNLTNLGLYDNQLTGSIPPEIGNLTNLDSLWLYGTELTGSIPPEIGNLTNLTKLGLWENQLTGEIPPEIGNLTNLTDLWLNNNQLTGSIPPEIGNLTNLEEWWLSYNNLTGSIPPEIGNLTNLKYLLISVNQLTGSIPIEMFNLTNMNQLYLWDNQLTGEIPPEIGNLTNLTDLSLGYNQLTGEIPPEIGNLTNLERLWLNNNQLSGIIPDEICNQGDSSPSLYNNQLCPPYPSCIEDWVGEQDTTNCD